MDVCKIISIEFQPMAENVIPIFAFLKYLSYYCRHLSFYVYILCSQKDTLDLSYLKAFSRFYLKGLFEHMLSNLI